MSDTPHPDPCALHQHRLSGSLTSGGGEEAPRRGGGLSHTSPGELPWKAFQSSAWLEVGPTLQHWVYKHSPGGKASLHRRIALRRPSGSTSEAETKVEGLPGGDGDVTEWVNQKAYLCPHSHTYHSHAIRTFIETFVGPFSHLLGTWITWR